MKKVDDCESERDETHETAHTIARVYFIQFRFVNPRCGFVFSAVEPFFNISSVFSPSIMMMIFSV